MPSNRSPVLASLQHALRIGEMKLAADGSPADPAFDIRVSGMFPEYLPLLAELTDHWEVMPFAYDWRKDIDLSAAALADAITSWSHGEPVHLVAHSMGGL